ncbi:hypothetical protein [uncultured Sutterella sp.]|uniref:ABC transporter permease n=1 Tax=uncultured Sutterella sp. TaxID=286133 RepID=UPI0025FCA379|nr:hypothetical protein [uncultured Sutterella sp.]
MHEAYLLVTGNYAIAMLLVFVKTLAEYGTPSTLGRRIGFDVFTTKIHAYATTAPVDFAPAATLSLVLITICMVMWMLQSSITASRSFRLVGAKGSRAAKWRLSTWARRAAGGYIAFVLFLSILVPWFSVLATSLIKIRGYGLAWGNFTVNHYVELFSEDVEGLSAFTNSLGLALAAGLIASVLGTAVVLLVRRTGRVGRFVEATALIPEMLPSIVLAIGLTLFWNRIYAYAPLYNTIGFMVLVYVILYLPYSIQYVSSAWMQMSPSLEEAGRVAGGSPAFVFRRVTLPLIAAGVIQDLHHRAARARRRLAHFAPGRPRDLHLHRERVRAGLGLGCDGRRLPLRGDLGLHALSAARAPRARQGGGRLLRAI